MKYTNISKSVFVFLIICFLFSPFDKAFALEKANGLSTPGSGSAGGCPRRGGSDWGSMYEPCGPGYVNNPEYDPQTYMMDLVYKGPNDSEYTILASAIVGKYASSENLSQMDFNKGARKHINYIPSEGTGDSIGSLAEIAKYLTNGRYLSEKKNDINKAIASNYLGRSGFNILDGSGKIKKNQSYSGYFNANHKQSNTLNDNYGFRIIIQKFISYGDCSCCYRGRHPYFLGLRKESEYARNATANNSGTKRGDLHTDEWILGISPGDPAGGSAPMERFANKMDGTGYNIIWINLDDYLRQYYDYTLDTYCGDCSSTRSDNVAFFAQDTTEWDAIKNSGDAANEYIRNYYKKNGSNLLCREEIKVMLPNANNKLSLQTGKYFTLNADSESRNILPIPVFIQNHGPVKVVRARECINATAADSENSRRNLLKNGGNTGVIKLSYKNNEYQKNDITLKKKSATVTGGGSGYFKQEVTVQYTMPDNVYSLIRKKDGKVVDSNQKGKEEVINLGLGVLPLSTKDGNATLSFKYELPGTDSWSKFTEVYKNRSLLKEDSAKTIYQKSIEGDSSVGDAIRNSACYKYYGDVGRCASIDSKNNSCTTSGNSASAVLKGSYNCSIKTYTPKDCRLDQSYNPNTGKCEDNPNGDCKSKEDAAKLNRAWNTKENKCCPAGQMYNSETGKCENGPGCPSSCIYGCCPSGICAPMPTVNGMVVCPYGGRKVIYRTIDLDNPFSGQNALIRKLGSNWCSYKNGKFDCTQSGSEYSKNVIFKTSTINRKNGKSVYNKTPLYKVSLKSGTITSIRGYNRGKKYDDFNLNCDDKGRRCISDFLNKNVSVSGSCANANKDNFYSCAGVVR